VLLNVEEMNAFPIGTFFFSRRRVRVFFSAIYRLYFFAIARRRPATVRRGPRFVRAFVRVL
jgi:hypothetical protein